MDGGQPYDPEATVFQAAAALERAGYTKGEIAAALSTVHATIGLEHTVHNYGRE